nr:MAG TPA: DNA protecting protein DprA Helix, DNA BINDING PROTEIN [Caudoviricetes sp.]
MWNTEKQCETVCRAYVRSTVSLLFCLDFCRTLLPLEEALAKFLPVNISCAK